MFFLHPATPDTTIAQRSANRKLRGEMSVSEAIDAMESFSANHILGDVTIRELIEEGRR